MKNKFPESILKKYPQLQKIIEAIESFKETGKQEVKCENCNGIIMINENRGEGFLEANCSCGKNRYRMRWDSSKE